MIVNLCSIGITLLISGALVWALRVNSRAAGRELGLTVMLGNEKHDRAKLAIAEVLRYRGDAVAMETMLRIGCPGASGIALDGPIPVDRVPDHEERIKKLEAKLMAPGEPEKKTLFGYPVTEATKLNKDGWPLPEVPILKRRRVRAESPEQALTMQALEERIEKLEKAMCDPLWLGYVDPEETTEQRLNKFTMAIGLAVRNQYPVISPLKARGIAHAVATRLVMGETKKPREEEEVPTETEAGE